MLKDRNLLGEPVPEGRQLSQEEVDELQSYSERFRFSIYWKTGNCNECNSIFAVCKSGIYTELSPNLVIKVTRCFPLLCFWK
jgi:hypothetical protein